MTYEKQNWKTGDIITSTKLNHMEDGIASGGVMVVHINDDPLNKTWQLDKTWQEIYDAINNDLVCFVILHNETGIQLNFVNSISFVEDTNDYYVNADDLGSFKTDAASGYPHMS